MVDQESITALLASAWCAVLGVDRVESADDFFELGGTSMTAVRLGAAVESGLGIRFPLEALFLDGTFGALVATCVAVTAPADPGDLDDEPSRQDSR